MTQMMESMAYQNQMLLNLVVINGVMLLIMIGVLIGAYIGYQRAMAKVEELRVLYQAKVDEWEPKLEDLRIQFLELKGEARMRLQEFKEKADYWEPEVRKMKDEALELKATLQGQLTALNAIWAKVDALVDKVDDLWEQYGARAQDTVGDVLETVARIVDKVNDFQTNVIPTVKTASGIGAVLSTGISLVRAFRGNHTKK